MTISYDRGNTWKGVPYRTLAPESLAPTGDAQPAFWSRIDFMTIVGIAFLLFIGVKLATESTGTNGARTNSDPITVSASAGDALSLEKAAPPPPSDLAGGRPTPATADLIVYPYDKYTLTQGPHGYSYGHLAIDLTAGRDAPILSPIEGVVKASFIDPYGNPTLVLENERYEVTLLHGQYTVETGDLVKLRQKIGTESNLGYTIDWQGRSCRDRDCGYHTHLNVYDKTLSQNVNPLEVLEVGKG